MMVNSLFPASSRRSANTEPTVKPAATQIHNPLPTAYPADTLTFGAREKKPQDNKTGGSKPARASARRAGAASAPTARGKAVGQGPKIGSGLWVEPGYNWGKWGDRTVGKDFPSERWHELNNWREKIHHFLTRKHFRFDPQDPKGENRTDAPDFPEGLLQVCPIQFDITPDYKMIKAMGRHGFLSHHADITVGERLREIEQGHRMKYSGLPYEMVINTNPAIAYLLEPNEDYMQKIVMAHVYFHVDFFQNNKYFRFTEPDKILQKMGDAKRRVEEITRQASVLLNTTQKSKPVRDTILDFHSLVERLTDIREVEPRKLRQAALKQRFPDLDEDAFQAQLQRAREQLNQEKFETPEERESYFAEFARQLDSNRKKFPKIADPDVFGFVLDHSKKMEPWQREVGSIMHEEMEYFKAQIRTKTINEGWATFGHYYSLLTHPEITLGEAGKIGSSTWQIASPTPNGINPYHIGFNLFLDIYKRAGLGLLEDRVDEDALSEKVQRMTDIEDIRRLKGFDEVRAWKKLKEIRAECDDAEFIERYLTPQLAKQLGLYETQTTRNGETIVSSTDFKVAKRALLNTLAINDFPDIRVVDGNYKQKQELLLRHEYTLENLNLEMIQEVLKILGKYWHQAVHLDTDIRKSDNSFTPIRITIRDGEVTFHKLNKPGGEPQQQVQLGVGQEGEILIKQK